MSREAVRMLTDAEKSQMQACLRALREAMPDYMSRRGQLVMMAEVAQALGSLGDAEEGLRPPAQRIAAIEAGTGTGKTLGYLLPAIVLARSRGRTVVVSSSTVALQEQLMAKDLPALQRHLPVAFSCALAKGRRRYVCPAKLLRPQAQQPVVGPGGSPVPHAPAQPVRLEGRLAHAFAGESWSGDRDEWPEPIPDGLWNRLSTDRQGCLGPRCADYARCPYQSARQRCTEAGVGGAHHDLVPAALGEEASAVAREAGSSLRLDRGLVEAVENEGQRLGADLAALHATLPQHCAFGDDSEVHRFPHGALPPGIAEAGSRIRGAAAALGGAWGPVGKGGWGRPRQDAVAAQPHVAALGACLGSAEHLAATWDGMLCPVPDGGKPMARWVERGGRTGGTTEYHVCAAPISGGERLRALLWERAGAAVLTSATLQACGSFDLFLEESGLDVYGSVRALNLPSPFDHQAQAEQHLTRMRSHPRDAEAHTQEVAARLPPLLEAQAGALVLFASARQMHQVEQALPPALRAEVLMQGTVSKRELLERHRARIDQGQRSVLFGLASLSEGVDLPGAYCTHLIMAKLPFAVPDDPVEQARREWIEAQGRSTPSDKLA